MIAIFLLKPRISSWEVVCVNGGERKLNIKQEEQQ